jgi:hypothetical protein
VAGDQRSGSRRRRSRSRRPSPTTARRWAPPPAAAAGRPGSRVRSRRGSPHLATSCPIRQITRVRRCRRDSRLLTLTPAKEPPPCPPRSCSRPPTVGCCWESSGRAGAAPALRRPVAGAARQPDGVRPHHRQQGGAWRAGAEPGVRPPGRAGAGGARRAVAALDGVRRGQAPAPAGGTAARPAGPGRRRARAGRRRPAPLGAGARRAQRAPRRAEPGGGQVALAARLALAWRDRETLLGT